MSDLAKLKKKAADLEQRRQFDRALAVYEEMLLAQEGSDDADVSLLNRVGDLRLRVGRPTEALDAYERAVDLYVERGFLNNAIALCNKILRQDPARADVHYRLGRISAEKGFRSDAKRHFLEYAGLMQRGGRLDEAFTALAQFAELSPDHTDVRLMLAEQLARHDRAEEAVAQLTTVLERYETERRFAEADEVAERIRALDPTFAAPAHAEFDPGSIEPHGRRSTPPRSGSGMADLVLIDPSDAVAAAQAAQVDAGVPAEPIDRVEVTSAQAPPDASLVDLPTEGFSSGADMTDADGYAGAAAGDAVAAADQLLDGFETTGFAGGELTLEAPVVEPVRGAQVEGLDEFEPTSLAEHPSAGASDEPEFLLEDPGAAGGAAQPLLELSAEIDLEDVEPRDAGDAVAAFQLDARDTTASDESGASGPPAPPDAVDAAFLAYEGEELVLEAAEPEAPAEPEIGGPLADDPLLHELEIEAVGPGELVIEPPRLDTVVAPSAAPRPAEAIAAAPVLRGDAALRFDQPSGEPAAGDDSFVNLGDLLRAEDGPRSTRMVTEEKAPTGDEQADFVEMLRKFKQGVAENVDDGDFESHHDLGVAYKEMGLLDEAVAAFQRALRGTPHRARTYEALGHCFLEREQYAVASGVLQRALAEPGADDQQLVGVLYLLGRAAEAMNQREEALSYYQRVFAVDIEFADVGERMESMVQVAR